jgi:glycosyltransferase involved in cell wall biosynthesis
MKLSLVIPCYNEAANLPLLLDRCDRLVDAVDAEVVLVDNGSTDDSPAVLETLLPNHPGCRSHRVECNQGYGFGILSGMAIAKGEILAWTHADMQTDPMDAARGLQFFEELDQPVFVKGRRFGRPFSDQVFTAGMSLFETVLFQRPFWDVNAQPTMFPRAFFQELEGAPKDFSIDLFFYHAALAHGLVIKRFPVRFGQRAHGLSNWNVNWESKRKFIQRTVDYSFKLRKNISS